MRHELERRGKSIIIVVAGPENPPFVVDAEVYEEDTYLALSADPEFQPTDEHPLRVMTEALSARPEVPGTVVVKSGRPLRLLAIIHKLDEDPTWREGWVAEALDGIFREVERRGLRSLSLPLLGTVHGKLNLERSVALLGDSLQRAQSTPLEHLWLRSGDHPPEQILDLIGATLL